MAFVRRTVATALAVVGLLAAIPPAVAQETHDEGREPSQDRPAASPPSHLARIDSSMVAGVPSTPFRRAASRFASDGRTAPADRMYVNASSTDMRGKILGSELVTWRSRVRRSVESKR